VDPADDAAGFEARLPSAKPYVLYRTQVEAQRAEDREAGRQTVKAFLESVPESLDRQAAWRWANDFFGTIRIRGGGTASTAAAPSAKITNVVDRIERGTLAGVITHPGLAPILAARTTPNHFRDETNRALRGHLVDGTAATGAALALLAELDAWAPQEGIDEPTAREYILRLQERELWSELQHADLERTQELREALARIQDEVAKLGGEGTGGRA
jgi:hypothetical protein